MKTWTNPLTLAALAATLTLAAGCTEDSMTRAGPEEALIGPYTQAEYREVFRRFAAETAAVTAALEEIRRTFTPEDMRARLWEERWPEIWGPDGRALGPHYWPTVALPDQLEQEVRTRYGPDWHSDEDVVADARLSMKTELDRYLFDANLERRRERHAIRERARERWRASDEVKR